MEQISADLRTSIEGLKIASTYLNISKELGVTMVYSNRDKALSPFLEYLEGYARQEKIGEFDKQVVFIGSSLKGVIEDNPSHKAQLICILESGKGNCQFHFLLTHPQFSALREIQEDRPKGGIAKEILHAISWLEDHGVPSENIRLYKGTPTNFMIASTERMLVNPYPYEREAYKCFCLELENNGTENSIFTSYWTNHYYRPWVGEQSRQDHYLVPNSLRYNHEIFDGPVPDDQGTLIGASRLFADFFVVNDTGSFYMAVNIRGLETQIRYSDQGESSYKLVEVGEHLTVKLLDLSDGSPKWEEVGNLELSDKRDGFWQRTLSSIKALEAYSMIGVFDAERESPFVFNDGSVLEGQAMPLLWKDLPQNDRRSPKMQVPLLPFHYRKKP